MFLPTRIYIQQLLTEISLPQLLHIVVYDICIYIYFNIVKELR
jgi:hypothetical protein